MTQIFSAAYISCSRVAEANGKPKFIPLLLHSEPWFQIPKLQDQCFVGKVLEGIKSNK